MTVRGKRDANEPEIRDAYLGAGFETIQLEDRHKAGLLDLLVIGLMPCPHCNRLFEQAKLIEVKTDKGAIRPEQSAMLARHPEVARLVRAPIAALYAVGRGAALINREARRVAQAGR